MSSIYPDLTLNIEVVNTSHIVINGNKLMTRDDNTLNDGNSLITNYLTLEENPLQLIIGTSNSSQPLFNVFETYITDVSQTDILTGYDVFNNKIKVTNNVMVFLNGRLLMKEDYTVIDENSIKLLITVPENNYFHIITDGVSKAKCYRYKATKEIRGMDLDGNLLELNSFDALIVFKNNESITPDKITVNDNLLTLTNVDFTEDDYIYICIFDGASKFLFYPKNGQTVFTGYDVFVKKLNYIPGDQSYKATLSEGLWGDLNEVQQGSVIKETYGNGEAIISDFNVDVSSTGIIIISDFDNTELASGMWEVQFPYSKSILDYLDGRTRGTKFIPDILKAYQRCCLDEIQGDLNTLKDIRNLYEINDNLLGNTLETLGMPLDYSEWTVDEKKRALENLNAFYRRAGTQKSVNYIGLINQKSMRILSQLWTNDYIHFYTAEELGGEWVTEFIADPPLDYGRVNSLVGNRADYGRVTEIADSIEDYGYLKDQQKGEWVTYLKFDPPAGYYPTNHLKLEYTLQDTGADSDDDIIKSEFYKTASVVWVLEQYAGAAFFNDANMQIDGASYYEGYFELYTQHRNLEDYINE